MAAPRQHVPLNLCNKLGVLSKTRNSYCLISYTWNELFADVQNRPWCPIGKRVRNSAAPWVIAFSKQSGSKGWQNTTATLLWRIGVYGIVHSRALFCECTSGEHDQHAEHALLLRRPTHKDSFYCHWNHNCIATSTRDHEIGGQRSIDSIHTNIWEPGDRCTNGRIGPT